MKDVEYFQVIENILITVFSGGRKRTLKTMEIEIVYKVDGKEFSTLEEAEAFFYKKHLNLEDITHYKIAKNVISEKNPYHAKQYIYSLEIWFAYNKYVFTNKYYGSKKIYCSKSDKCMMTDKGVIFDSCFNREFFINAIIDFLKEERENKIKEYKDRKKKDTLIDPNKPVFKNKPQRYMEDHPKFILKEKVKRSFPVRYGSKEREILKHILSSGSIFKDVSGFFKTNKTILYVNAHDLIANALNPVRANRLILSLKRKGVLVTLISKNTKIICIEKEMIENIFDKMWIKRQEIKNEHS